MKDTIKRVLVAVLAVTFLAVCIPQKAEAAVSYTYVFEKILPIKNQYMKIPKYEFKNKNTVLKIYALEIDVPEDGYVVLKTDSKDKKIKVNSMIQNGVDPQDTSKGFLFNLSGSTTYYRVLPKGTYYLWSLDNGINISYSFKSVKNPTNYARVTAKKLKKNTKTRIVFNHGNEYSRWFRIDLAQAQKLNITLNYLDETTTISDPYFSVFNSKGDAVTCKKSKGKYVTSKLKKGKYYVRVDYPFAAGKPWSIPARIRDFTWQ